MLFSDIFVLFNQAMEWYYGRSDEDVTVPKDEEMFEGLPSSPDSWPSWVNIVGNCNSQKKLNALEAEEFFSEPMFSRHGSCQQSACEHSDAHLNDLPKIEEAEDIFLYKRTTFIGFKYLPLLGDVHNSEG